MKKVIITGAFGQDGFFLTELLSKDKEYEMICCGRNLSNIASNNYLDPSIRIASLNLLNDYEILSLVKSEKPDIVYNLAGFSSPLNSWNYPLEALHANGLAVLTFLEAIKNHSPKTKFFNACSAKIFSTNTTGAQSLDSVIDPNEPYGLGKYMAYQLIKQYRSKYGLFACSGILYNHESHLKNDNFVVYKICHNAKRLKKGVIQDFDLLNLDSTIDFGDPRDFVEAMTLMMKAKKPEDMIIATNFSISIRELCLKVGEILEIKNILSKVKISSPSSTEKPIIRGDNSRLFEIGWKPKYTIEDTLRYMIENIKA
jgi:GDPmannose 4,6-dehydratase